MGYGIANLTEYFLRLVATNLFLCYTGWTGILPVNN